MRRKGQRKVGSIRARLSWLVVAVIAVTTLTTLVVSGFRETTRYAEARKAELTATAQVFATVVAEPLLVSDRPGVLTRLTAMGRLPSISHVAVRDRSGRTFAELGGDVVIEGRGDAAATPLLLLLGREIAIQVPIVKGGVEIGTLSLFARSDDLRDRVEGGLLVALAAALAAAAVGLLIAYRMQRRITGPIRALTATMAEVRREHDYSRVVERLSDDETGLMVDAFNEMMTEVRARDAQIQLYTEHLEHQVEERTADLRTAKDVAERASAAKSEFLATMSHEIRTPMNGVLVMAELLASAGLDGRSRRYADVILKSGRSLLAIINDILDFSKIESGKLTIEQIPFDPVEAIEDVVGLFHERARSKGLDFGLLVSGEVPAQIAGDPVRFTQVVSNLVNNALKFTETGRVTVTVERIDPPRPGVQTVTLRVAVVDTGIGIRADKLDGIFDPFTQADQTTTRKFGGTGLGLAIVRKLVEAMNGTIAVTSRVGHGSTFAFTLKSRVERPALAPPPAARGRAFLALSPSLEAEGLERAARALGLAARLVSPSALGTLEIGRDDVVFAAPETLVSYGAYLGSERPGFVAVVDLADAEGEDLLAAGRVDEVLIKPVRRAALGDIARRFAEGRLGEGRGVGVGDAVARFDGLDVLVADDSAINREVIVEALGRLGIVPETVPDGRSALDAVSKRRFHLVFMDCSMPDIDGFETTRRIRKLEAERSLPRVPVVALTAHVAGTTGDTWRSAGMDDYVEKPFKLERIRRVVAAFAPAAALPPMKLVEPDDIVDVEVPVAPPAPPPVPTAETVTPVADDLPVVDEATVRNLGELGEGGGLLARVVRLYEIHGPGAVEKLCAFGPDADPAAVAEAAHALKSMSLNVGAARVAAAALSVERAASAGDLSSLSTQALSVESEFHQALPELLRRVGERAARPAA